MTFPVDKFSSVEIEQVSDTRVSSPRLFRYRSSGNKSPYWMISLTSAPLAYADGVALSAYLDGLQGALTVFDLPNPLPALATNTGCQITTTAGDGASSLTVNTPNDCRAGDFIQIAGNSKVYRITQDSLGAGTKTITITPPLVASVPTAPTNFNYGQDVTFQVALENRSNGTVSASSGKFITHDVELIEQL